MTVPTNLIYALIFEALVGLVAPPLIAFYVDRKLQVGWRWIWYGAIVFLIVEIAGFVVGALASFSLTRLLGPPELRPLATVNAIRAVRTATVAGITEEVCRYVGYLLFFRAGERDWDRAVMYGLGGGGFESMADKSLRSMLTVATLVFVPRMHPGDYGLTDQKLAPIFQLWKKTAATPAWEPLLGSLARVGVIAFHMCLAAMVLQVFRRGTVIWLFYAIAFHIVIDVTIFIIAAYSVWLGNLASLGWAIVSLVIMFSLREMTPASPSQPPAERANAFDTIQHLEGA